MKNKQNQWHPATKPLTIVECTPYTSLLHFTRIAVDMSLSNSKCFCFTYTVHIYHNYFALL
jgi:hypothetical protein